MLEVRSASGFDELRAVSRVLRERLYLGLPGWHAPPEFLELERFDRAKEPFWKTHAGETFVARQDGRVAGRVTVFVPSPGAGGGAGRFGVFDCVDKVTVARALLEAGAAWLKAHGATRMEGPFFFSMHEEVGVLTRGFETPPAVLMPFNPPHYAALLEAAGFRSIRRFITYRYVLDDCYGRVAGSGGTGPTGVAIRSFDLSRAESESARLLEVYNSAFSENWGFTPLGEAEGKVLVANLIRIGHPDLVRIAELDGQVAGFVLCLPDINGWLFRIRRWPEPFKTLLLAWGVWRRKARECRVVTLAVRREHQGRRLARDLMDSLAKEARAAGYGNAELSYVDTDNERMQRLMAGYRFGTAKEYHLYGRELAGEPGR